jgi:hypothetical protein
VSGPGRSKEQRNMHRGLLCQGWNGTEIREPKLAANMAFLMNISLSLVATGIRSATEV